MNKTKILFLFISILLIKANLIYSQATKSLEVIYPTIPHAPNISLLGYLPDYIRYVYVFIVVAGGLMALVILIIGGFRYLTSAGNPSIMSDAKNQILSAFIGLIVILGSYVALNELNPEAITLNPPELVATGQGIIVYTDQNCGDGSNGLPNVVKPLPADIKFLRVESTSRYGEGNFTLPFSVSSFYTFNGEEDLTIEFYSNNDCQTGFLKRIPNSALPSFNARSCVDLSSVGGTIQPVKCIKIIWHKPGVYLYSYTGGNPQERVPDGECFMIYQNSVGGFPNCLHDKVRSIALVDDSKNGVKYGAILHNLPQAMYGKRQRGWAHVYLPNSSQEITLYDTKWIDASSLTVFQPNPGAINSSIKICRNPDCEFADEEPSEIHFLWEGDDGQWQRVKKDGTLSDKQNGGLRKLTGLDSVYPNIIRGARFIHKTGDGFDGKWWEDGDLIADAVQQLPFSAPGGISSMQFMQKDATYIAILYDMANAITNSSNQDNGIFFPAGSAFLTGTSEADLSQDKWDNVTGSILLIRARIQ